MCQNQFNSSQFSFLILRPRSRLTSLEASRTGEGELHMRHLRSCTIENLESLTDYNVQADGPSPDPTPTSRLLRSRTAGRPDGRHARAFTHFYLRLPSSRAFTPRLPESRFHEGRVTRAALIFGARDRSSSPTEVASLGLNVSDTKESKRSGQGASQPKTPQSWLTPCCSREAKDSASNVSQASEN